jgi:predicted acylesterase/phospholipase RssA
MREPAPLRVQVAFQGGGARIFGHLAVCEVLRKFSSSDENRIQITRVAGSSAGALAAAAISSNEAITTIKERFARLGRELQPRLADKGCRHLLKRLNRYRRVIWGGPYFNEIDLVTVFKEIYHPENSMALVQQADAQKPKTLIYFTDLTSRRLRPSPPDNVLAQALADSCNFPFAFSGWQNRTANLDAGLAQNLPIDDLYAGQAEYGEVIAIAFEKELAKSDGLPLFGYVQQLFATAIEASVDRSVAILGENNVFRIKTDVTTFDFGQALTSAFGSPYSVIRSTFEEWFRRWLVTRHDRSNWVKPTNTTSTMPSAISRQLSDDMSASATFSYDDVMTADIAQFDEAGKFTQRYRTQFRSTVRFLRPAHLIKFHLELEESVGQSDLRCAAYDEDYHPIGIEVYVHKSSTASNGRMKYEIFYCFDKEMGAGERCVFEYEAMCRDPYEKLGHGLEYTALRATNGDVRSGTLAVAFPKARLLEPKVYDMAEATDDVLGQIGYLKDKGTMVKSDGCKYADVAHFLNLDTDAGRYFFAIRRASMLPQGHCMGLVIEP